MPGSLFLTDAVGIRTSRSFFHRELGVGLLNNPHPRAHSLLRPRAQCAISNGRQMIGRAFMLIFHGRVGLNRHHTVGRLAATGEGNGSRSSSATSSLSISAESHLLTPALIAHKGFKSTSERHSHTCNASWLPEMTQSEICMFDRTKLA